MSRSEAPGSSVGLLEQLEVRVLWLRAPVPLAGTVTAPGWRERTATALLALRSCTSASPGSLSAPNLKVLGFEMQLGFGARGVAVPLADRGVLTPAVLCQPHLVLPYPLLAVQEPASITSAGVLPGQTKCFAACWSAQVKLFSLECKWENGFKSEKHLNLKCPVMGAS